MVWPLLDSCDHKIRSFYVNMRKNCCRGSVVVIMMMIFADQQTVLLIPSKGCKYYNQNELIKPFEIPEEES